MAACGSIHHIFEKPILPESPSILSSWNIHHLKSINEQQQSSFTELFGELHFKENSPSSSSSVSSFIDLISSSSSSETNEKSSDNNNKTILSPSHSPAPDSNFKKINSSVINNGGGESFSPIKNYESLQLCTEGLGFESFDDVEDLKNEDWQQQQVSVNKRKVPVVPEKKLRCGGGGFPPPISSIGKSGKPWISFKSYRHDGRFVLKQVKMPSQEILHAHREDGRLKLHFLQPITHHDHILHEQEEEDEQQDDQENEQEEEEDIVCSNK